jgi:hypothetical protein
MSITIYHLVDNLTSTIDLGVLIHVSLEVDS